MSGHGHNGKCCQSCYRWHCTCSQENTSSNRRSPLFGHEPQCYNFDNYCHCASSEPYRLPPEGSGTAHSPPEPPYSIKMSIEEVRACYSSKPYHTHPPTSQPYQLPHEGSGAAQSLPGTAFPTSMSAQQVIAHCNNVREQQQHLPDYTLSLSTCNHHKQYSSWASEMGGDSVVLPSGYRVPVPPHTSPPPYSSAGDPPPSYEEATSGPQYHLTLIHN